MADAGELGRDGSVPVIHVISDSIGITARSLARAAYAQFGVVNPPLEVLSRVRSADQIRSFLEEHVAMHSSGGSQERILVFYTLVNRELSSFMREYSEQNPHVVAVDLLTDSVNAIASVSGLAPASEPGVMRSADVAYFKRIEAEEFTIMHDDGRNPQDLPKADIVLIGVSRSSKTPLSIYLAQQGYRVANVPLDPQTDPPKEIALVERTRLFGLMTSPDVLIGIRKRRLGSAASVAASYADREYVEEDLRKSRELMRSLGCRVIHTENRAVEETAQEILRYYVRSHEPIDGAWVIQ